MQDIHILIADDQYIVRNGLKIMLSLQSFRYNFLVSEAVDGEEAISKAVKKDFDLIFLDYSMPKFKGDEVISRIMVHKPDAKIIVLSNYDEGGFVRSCINNGAKGYILKDIDPTDLIEAIETVYAGGVYYSGQVSDKLQAVVEAPEKIDISLSKKLGLSRRELEILRFIAGEYTNEQIGKELGISKRTVDTHRQNLLHKTHAKNTAGLIRFAITNAVV